MSRPNIADRKLTAADLRGPLVTDGIQRWKTADGHKWMVRVGLRALDWAEIDPGLADHLDHMLAVGDLELDGDPAEVGMEHARYAMAHDDRHVEMLRLAKRHRLYSADGINYFTGPANGPAEMLDDDQIEAVGDLVHYGYLSDTRRPGPDGTTAVEIRLVGLDALRQWDAA